MNLPKKNTVRSISQIFDPISDNVFGNPAILTIKIIGKIYQMYSFYKH